MYPKEVPAFPNPGVRLIKEDEEVAIWEEVFEPGKPNNNPSTHTRLHRLLPEGGKFDINTRPALASRIDQAPEGSLR
jgi:hypothetical protein